MIDRSVLPSWHAIYELLGERPPRRNRARCVIHGGDSPVSVSVDERQGLFYCHVCGAGGDKITFVEKVRDCSFHEACAFLGLRGEQLKPDPEALRRRRIREGLQRWARETAKELRYERYVRERVIAAAERRLRRDAQDEWAWRWLAWAYVGLDALEHKLDLLEGKEANQVEAYTHMRGDAA